MVDKGIQIGMTEGRASELTSKVLIDADRVNGLKDEKQVLQKDKSLDEKVTYYSQMTKELLESSAVLSKKYTKDYAEIIRAIAHDLCIYVIRQKLTFPEPLTPEEKADYQNPKIENYLKEYCQSEIAYILYDYGKSPNQKVIDFVDEHFKGSIENKANFVHFSHLLAGMVRNIDIVYVIAASKFRA